MVSPSAPGLRANSRYGMPRVWIPSAPRTKVHRPREQEKLQPLLRGGRQESMPTSIGPSPVGGSTTVTVLPHYIYDCMYGGFFD